MTLRCGVAVIALTALTSCASTSPKVAVQATSTLIKARSGNDITWFGDESDDAAQKQVSALLRRDLDLANAIRISLLANRHLQSLYEELGIAQADLVQAGLLKNPRFDATYDFPLDHGYAYQFGFVTDLLQLITMSSRKEIARAALEGAKYRIAGEVLHHIYDVKSAYFALQAAQQTSAMRQIVSDAAHAAAELAKRQHEAQTISDLDLANEETLYAFTLTELRRAQSDVVVARERLTRLMGVSGSDADWVATAKLDEIPPEQPNVDDIESTAIAARYDLLAARKDVQVVSYGLSLAKKTRWTGVVDVGIDLHREPEGVRLIGPSVSVELPIFDQGQATIARIEAQLRRAKNRERALTTDIRSEVRELVARLSAIRALVEDYRQTLVPLRTKVVALSQQRYNAMLAGAFELLIAKQNEVNTYREFIDVVRDYWTRRAELEWKAGGALKADASPMPNHEPSKTDNAAPPGEHHHEHHAP